MAHFSSRRPIPSRPAPSYYHASDSEHDLEHSQRPKQGQSAENSTDQPQTGPNPGQTRANSPAGVRSPQQAWRAARFRPDNDTEQHESCRRPGLRLFLRHQARDRVVRGTWIKWIEMETTDVCCGEGSVANPGNDVLQETAKGNMWGAGDQPAFLATIPDGDTGESACCCHIYQ